MPRSTCRIVIVILCVIAVATTSIAASDSRSCALSGHPDESLHANTETGPFLQIREPSLGIMRYESTSPGEIIDVVAGQPLTFVWIGAVANNDLYVESYRWGVDLADPDDPDDPGWGVEPGLHPPAMIAELLFHSGQHTLTIDCRDNGGGLARTALVLNVLPLPDPENQLPLLLIDDVRDVTSNGWLDEEGLVAYDNDVMRDARWLELIGDVPGFDPYRDVIDVERGDQLDLRDVIDYRVIIWASRDANASYAALNFEPEFDTAQEVPRIRLPYVWLTTYQRYVGNLLLVGSGAVNNFHRQSPDGLGWMYPVIYSLDTNHMNCDLGIRARSFGIYFPVHCASPLGPMFYPYLGLGLSATDRVWAETTWGSPSECLHGDDARDRQCGATKALYLDYLFSLNFSPNGELPETIITWDELDWVDQQGGLPDIFQPSALGIWDEFYEFDATLRPETWWRQTLPNGWRTTYPMFCLQTRYDWIRQQHRDAGDMDFPEFEPEDVCGEGLFDTFEGPGTDESTKIDGAPIGVLSYAAVETKPSGKPDVIWGFDPTRFDPVPMAQTVRWVLDTLFGLEGHVSIDPPEPETPQIVRPEQARLHPARPNPFNPRTELAYALDRPGHVQISVYDVQGRRVATLVDGARPAGEHVAVWEGRDDAGRGLPSGAYLVRLITESGAAMQRVTLMK